MKNCPVCSAPMKALMSKRCADGTICSACYSLLPAGVPLEQIGSLTVRVLLSNLSADKGFQKTAAYGSLQIDERRGLLAVKRNGSKLPAVFNGYDCTDISLSCSKPHVDSHGNVFCNIILRFTYTPLGLPIEIKIKPNVKYKKERMLTDQIEISEPGDLSMFRSMFANAVGKSYAMKAAADEAYSETITVSAVSDPNDDLRNAMALFMLEDGYTAAQVRQMRNKLIKAFHPDVSDEADVYAQKINNAYEVLMKNIEV